MSLRVWLPLTKDLRQQGLDNMTVINNGATFNSAGKLGGCYSFDGTDDRIAINDISIPINSSSLCCWFKASNTTSADRYIISLNNTSGFSDQQLGVYQYGSGVNLISGGVSYFSFTITENTWYHVCITRKNNTVVTYLNGVKQSTSTASDSLTGTHLCIGARCNSSSGAQAAAIYYFNGKLNDVRIYDHCLSPMEVKELAKGLVLHYPLNRQGWGQENLVLNSGYFTSVSGWTNNQNTTVSLDNNELKVVLNQTNSTPGIKTVNTINFSAGTYTASILVKITNRSGTNKIYFPFYLYNGSATVYSGQPTVLKQYGDYLYEEATFTVSETINNTTLYILQSGPENGETWYIKWVKIEKGSIATPWCPNSSDTLATTMGLNSTTEYDCSGFCNNGTRTGTFSWTSDTPKYAVSQYFASTNGQSGNSVYKNGFAINDNKFTIACWVKIISTVRSGSAEYIICLNNTTYSGDMQFSIFHRSNTLTIIVNNTEYTIQSLSNNTWYHLALTFDGSNANTYINGILKNTTAISNAIYLGTNLNIGARSSIANGSTHDYYSNIYVSDARVYATALSADDVKSLYQNSAYIDSNGNIYGTIHET